VTEEYMPAAFMRWGWRWLFVTRIDRGIWWLGITPWLIFEIWPIGLHPVVKFFGREWGPGGEPTEDG